MSQGQTLLETWLPLGNDDGSRASHVDEFCQDTNADLLRRSGMNVKANRCMHPIQPFPRNPLGFEGLPDLGNPGLAAEHTQVASWTVIELLQDGMVVPMPARHQYHIIILAEVEHLPHVRKWHGQGRIGFWKAFLIDKGR